MEFVDDFSHMKIIENTYDHFDGWSVVS